MKCLKPVRLTKNLDRREFPDGLLVPCGKCFQCRIQKRQEWTIRMIHELDSWESSSFITLTYDDEHCPPFHSLVKKDLQKFFKRLRKRLSYDDRKIKYYACGEYGDQTHRPHYHAIIFGLAPTEKRTLEKVWPFGFVHTGIAEPDSIRYVAQYIDKKLTGDEAIKEYTDKNREAVFRILSQGIGKEFVKKNKEQILRNEKITHHGRPYPFPRYYIKLLEMENSTFRKEIAKQADRKIVLKYTGIEGYTEDELYNAYPPNVIMKLNDRVVADRVQNDKNLKAKNYIKTHTIRHSKI